MTILGRSEELVSRCVECDLAEPESLASLGGSAPGVVDGILSISLTIMGQRQTYNSIHKPQQSTNETLGFNQDDHPYRMCNETGIPMVVMVTSHTRSLCDPTQQDFINVHTLPIYKCHTCFKFWRTLQSTLCNIVYNQEGTPKMKHMLIFWEMHDSSMSFTPILPKTSQHTIHKV